MKKLITVALLAAATSMIACSKDSASSGGAAPPSGAAAPVKAEALEIPGTGAEFMPPAGWDKEQKAPWTIMATKPDANGNVSAVMAFVTFNQPNESTAKLGTLAQVLELSDIQWGGRETLELPSRLADRVTAVAQRAQAG